MAETKTPILETKKLGITFGGLKAVQDFNIIGFSTVRNGISKPSISFILPQ